MANELPFDESPPDVMVMAGDRMVASVTASGTVRLHAGHDDPKLEELLNKSVTRADMLHNHGSHADVWCELFERAFREVISGEGMAGTAAPDVTNTELGAVSQAATCSAFERAAQLCRYYLKHQNHSSRWEQKSDYEQGVQIACENLASLMLKEAGKLNVEAGASLEELAANWERAGFGSVAATTRDLGQNESLTGQADKDCSVEGVVV